MGRGVWQQGWQGDLWETRFNGQVVKLVVGTAALVVGRGWTLGGRGFRCGGTVRSGVTGWRG